jgi:hypothetical protein
MGGLGELSNPFLSPWRAWFEEKACKGAGEEKGGRGEGSEEKGSSTRVPYKLIVTFASHSRKKISPVSEKILKIFYDFLESFG